MNEDQLEELSEIIWQCGPGMDQASRIANAIHAAGYRKMEGGVGKA